MSDERAAESATMEELSVALQNLADAADSLYVEAPHRPPDDDCSACLIEKEIRAARAVLARGIMVLPEPGTSQAQPRFIALDAG